MERESTKAESIAHCAIVVWPVAVATAKSSEVKHSSPCQRSWLVITVQPCPCVVSTSWQTTARDRRCNNSSGEEGIWSGVKKPATTWWWWWQANWNMWMVDVILPVPILTHSPLTSSALLLPWTQGDTINLLVADNNYNVIRIIIAIIIIIIIDIGSSRRTWNWIYSPDF